jgi:hypothetical protein
LNFPRCTGEIIPCGSDAFRGNDALEKHMVFESPAVASRNLNYSLMQVSPSDAANTDEHGEGDFDEGSKVTRARLDSIARILGRDSPIFLQFFYLFSIFFLSFF